ncbi:uncharacterized protein LOC129924040 [Biomphalaria glabrata]|uniref:Uncharacterized protein LOC129924040 n=1 Tax=Biomphalaria glabrata TaxID=6526 RepID=A0A9W2ZFF0_BIOGL|nr:uncharacterized protein LOC129924040 [Biomphalaria glabrata]
MLNTTYAYDAIVTVITTKKPKWQYYVCWYRAESQEQITILYAMQCFVNPALSILGFSANMLSLVILVRSGLRRSSDILLFSLVIADSMCLFKTMDYAIIIDFFGPDKFIASWCGYQYDVAINYFLAYSQEIFMFIGFWGSSVNSLIPVIITIERLLAVFLPMTFRTIVTTKRTIILSVTAFVFWLPWSSFIVACLEILNYNMSEDKIWTSLDLGELYINNARFFTIFSLYFIDTLVSWFPLTVIILGCCSVWIKVKITLRQRQNMTSAQKISWSPRTTQTLLLTCLIFALTHSATSVIVYLWPAETQVQVFIRNMFMDLLYLINASSNFFVYISTNPKLHTIFINIVQCQK